VRHDLSTDEPFHLRRTPGKRFLHAFIRPVGPLIRKKVPADPLCSDPKERTGVGSRERPWFCGFPAILLYNSEMESVVMKALAPSRESLP
jgi:hypothetical protein